MKHELSWFKVRNAALKVKRAPVGSANNMVDFEFQIGDFEYMESEDATLILHVQP